MISPLPRLRSADPVFNRFQDNLGQLLRQVTAPEVWQSPPLLNSWTNLSNTDSQLGYYKDPAGIVHLRGHAAGGSIGTTVFVLPANYRPTMAMRFPVVSNGAFGYCRILSTGEVAAAAGSSVWFSLDGISFDTR